MKHGFFEKRLPTPSVLHNGSEIVFGRTLNLREEVLPKTTLEPFGCEAGFFRIFIGHVRPQTSPLAIRRRR